MSRTDLRKYLTFKVVKQLNPIGSMKTCTKPNCNLCMEERLTILKKLRDKRVMIMNKNSVYMGPADTILFPTDFVQALMIPYLTGERVRPLNVFQIL